MEHDKRNLDQVRTWTREFFKAFDNGDANYYDHFDANVSFQGGNAETVKGLENLKPAFEGVRQDQSYTTQHNLLQMIITDENATGDYVIAVELRVDYQMNSGKQFSIPCATIFKIKDFKITDYRAFLDAAPLMAALKA